MVHSIDSWRIAMVSQQRRFTAKFKFRIALGVLRGDKTIQTPQAQQRPQDVINKRLRENGGTVG
jgi:hypothetical protein